MRVAVVEAAGPVARRLAEKLLADGHEVIDVPRSPDDWDAIHQACHVADAVAYLPTAWSTASGGYEERWVECLATVLRGSGKRLIYLSDASVVGPTTRPADEDSAISDDAPHPWKARNEHRLARAITEGVRSVVIRPVPFYGGELGGPIDQLRSIALGTGVAMYIDSGAVRTSTVHVDDLIRLICLALKRAPAGGHYFAASPEVVTWRQVADVVRAQSPTACQAVSVTPAVASSAGLDVRMMMMDLVVHDAAARRLLGWSAQEAPFFGTAVPN